MVDNTKHQDNPANNVMMVYLKCSITLQNPPGCKNTPQDSPMYQLKRFNPGDTE